MCVSFLLRSTLMKLLILGDISIDMLPVGHLKSIILSYTSHAFIHKIFCCYYKNMRHICIFTKTMCSFYNFIKLTLNTHKHIFVSYITCLIMADNCFKYQPIYWKCLPICHILAVGMRYWDAPDILAEAIDSWKLALDVPALLTQFFLIHQIFVCTAPELFLVAII
jgi:hypothetical protein